MSPSDVSPSTNTDSSGKLYNASPLSPSFENDPQFLTQGTKKKKGKARKFMYFEVFLY